MNDPKAAAAYHPGDVPVPRPDLDALIANLREDPRDLGLILQETMVAAAAALDAERARADQAEAKLAAITPLFAFGTFGSGSIDDASREQLVVVCNKAADRSDKVRQILSAVPNAEQ